MLKAVLHFVKASSSRNQSGPLLRLVRNMASSTQRPTFTNRLAQEKSPYLLQHAHNPVDWYPWGEEAFAKARAENKPIFLSVGYSTCHWCHVMERESFENPEVGQMLNENFVSIKVDREERPDVDKVYMTFVQATTGSGGWPMSVWLTPDLKPIIGGTYFPPNDRYYKKPGFMTILTLISHQWQEKRSEVESKGSKILDLLMTQLSLSDHGSCGVPALEASIECFDMLEERFDEEYGGFGSAPKFPQPVQLNVLFRIFNSDPSGPKGTYALQMCLLTLTKMSNGGIHDHISQGFHRYSTDRKWHVPHFEKMLYDQGQLAVSYVDAYQITKDTLFADIATDIFTYVSRDLSHPEGGFYSAEDADSLPLPTSQEKKEGAFCVWTKQELDLLLSEKIPGNTSVTLAEIFNHFYDVKEDGNVDPLQDPHDELKHQNVLIVSSTAEKTASKFGISPQDVEFALEKSRKIVYEARQLRPRPHLDNKMVSAWNGLMISGFARGGQVMDKPHLIERAIQAATFMRRHLFQSDTQSLLRSCYTGDNLEISQIVPPIQGFVDDYAFVIRGLLDLYEASFDDQWLAWAEQLQTRQNQLFWDNENGGFFSSPEGDNSIVLRLKEDHDGVEPSPNSVSAMNLQRLAIMLNRPDWTAMAEKIFKVFCGRIEKVPITVTELVSSLIFYHSKKEQIIIIGDKKSEDTKALIQTVHKYYLPNKVLLVTDGQTDEFLKERLSHMSSFVKVDNKATAYVCQNFTCALPVNSCEELEKILQT